jgi:ribosomal protein S27AE
MHDDEDGADFDEAFDDYEAEEPLRLIKNTSDAAPKVVRMPAVCPQCGKVFLASGAIDGAKYTCPGCKKVVKPQRLSDKNTPVADPLEE